MLVNFVSPKKVVLFCRAINVLAPDLGLLFYYRFCFDLNGFPFAIVFGACCAVEMPRVEMPFSKTPSI